MAAKRSRRIYVYMAAGLVVLLSLVVVGLDHWLPYMLLSHYKFAVDKNPHALRDSGATLEQISFQTQDGLTIRGWFIPAAAGRRETPATVIVLHTLGRTRQDVLEFALPFREKGFNLALIDMRGHGESDGQFFTYGYHEWKDVAGLIDWLEARKDVAAENIHLLGVSAGGAVAIVAASRDSRIKALVSVASFADLGEMIKGQSPWLPRFWRERAVRKAEHLADFSVADASPLKNIAQVKCPVLLVHGDTDDYVPYSNAERLFARANDPKVLYTIPGGNHANMFAKGGKQLTDTIAKFMSDCQVAAAALERIKAAQEKK